MHSPFVVPVSGYRTLSRFEMLSCRPATSTVVDGFAAAMGEPLRGLARPRLDRLHVLALRLARGRRDGNWISGAGRMALAGVLRRFHARLERGHEVHDLRRRSLDHRRLELLAGGLALDEIEHLLAVVVVEAVGLERPSERLDERLGHLHFL